MGVGVFNNFVEIGRVAYISIGKNSLFTFDQLQLDRHIPFKPKAYWFQLATIPPGPFKHRLVAIVDVINQKSALVDGPGDRIIKVERLSP